MTTADDTDANGGTAPEPLGGFARIAQRLANVAGLLALPDRMAALHQACVIGADLFAVEGGVSLSVGHDSQLLTFAASNALVLSLDERQYEAGRGPCVEALRGNVHVESAVLATESRWPEWTAAALASGIGSMCCFPVIGSSPLAAAVNVYNLRPDDFADPRTLGVAELFTAHVSVLLTNLLVTELANSEVAQMREAMASRASIEQAKGVLMGALAVDPDTAFGYLIRLSQNRHEKLRDVATATISQAAAGKFRSPPA